MPIPRSRSTFGDERVDLAITKILSLVGNDANDDLVRSMVVTSLDMDVANLSRLDLKIANQTLVEILNAWDVFSPYEQRAKVTIFGSARTKPDTPDYDLARTFAETMTERGWMTITGAGPGIMTAGIEGSGPDSAFGVNISLPFEQQASTLFSDTRKLATFKYFFTRKLTFMKESDAFVVFPGGFGTLDEAFELLTLIQTGKSFPAPVVLIDHEGSTYWDSWQRFVESELLDDGMISPADMGLFLHTHDAAEAADYVSDFYRCYHSIRFVGRRLVIRLRRPVTDRALATLNDEFADIVTSGPIERIETTSAEQRDDDVVELPRLGFRFDHRSYARLVAMIRRINELGSDSPGVVDGFVHDIAPDPETTGNGDDDR
ncbi:MAG: LOG family protein [Acidimicrobiales bacterium]